ncbi:hypothetical protein [Gordoniibacillus kamchatkensis]|nr:hypothetical protein [Paenibacillus sp. VKM B-2647]
MAVALQSPSSRSARHLSRAHGCKKRLTELCSVNHVISRYFPILAERDSVICPQNSVKSGMSKQIAADSGTVFL